MKMSLNYATGTEYKGALQQHGQKLLPSGKCINSVPGQPVLMVTKIPAFISLPTHTKAVIVYHNVLILYISQNGVVMICEEMECKCRCKFNIIRQTNA